MAKVLVADDDLGILEVMKVILEDKNHQVKLISEGFGVEGQVKEYMPDIILLDIWMSGQDGKEIAQRLKQDDQTKHIPIVMVSALNDTKQIAREAGANDYLEKPFNIEDLIAIVDKYTS